MLIKMYEDTIAFYKSVPRQQDKCRERTTRQLSMISIDNNILTGTISKGEDRVPGTQSCPVQSL